MDEFKEYLEYNHLEFFQNREIKDFLTIKIGGKVKFIVIVYDLDHLKNILRIIHKCGHRFVLLGGGSNVLFSDHFSPLIVIINRTAEKTQLKKDQIVRVDSGVLNKDFLSWSIMNSIGGMDFLAGIPGTIGGAGAVNAGAFGKSMADILKKAEIFSPAAGEIKSVGKDYFQFSYRDSIFKRASEVILKVYLSYKPQAKDKIKNQILTKVKYRQNNHPSPNLWTSGCFFKNPVINNNKISAGQLIEETGLKGYKYRQLMVSDKHSNFIINQGQSKFDDILELESKIRTMVQNKTGISLEREVSYISPQGEKY
jgi:UDP-N-acetylmuramate dehydrogenase